MPTAAFHSCSCRSLKVICASLSGTKQRTLRAVADARSGGQELAHQRHSTVKRKVAVHFGYVGTHYRGSQFQRDGTGNLAVEDVLERALLSSGAILPSNAGASHKLGWSRNSRTDKGVHSLSTVAGLKIECEADIFDHDPEGMQLARRLAAYLPSEVAVFSIQRTNKSFNARQQCKDRTYCYHLPASLLGLTGVSGDDAAVMSRLRACLNAFVGYHPFHNYTDRRRYRKESLDKQKRRARTVWKTRSRDGTASAAAPPGVAAEAGPGRQSGGDDGVEGLADDMAADTTSKPEALGSRNSWTRNADDMLRPEGDKRRWQHGEESWDKVSQSHYRHVLDATASEAAELIPGGPLCVTIALRGSSFMDSGHLKPLLTWAISVAVQQKQLPAHMTRMPVQVYQIRHMVATAACVALGLLPLEVVNASLAAPARVVLPLAPARGLVLTGASFFDFPEPPPGGRAAVGICGPALALRSGGRTRMCAFEHEVLRPALSAELEAEAWSDWRQQLSEKYPLGIGQVERFLDACQAWHAGRSVLPHQV